MYLKGFPFEYTGFMGKKTTGWNPPAKPETVKAAIYARVSTHKQEDLNQLRELREFASNSKWEIAREYVDHAVSGARSDREQFQALMLDAHKKKFNTVLFWSLDRFSREGVEATLEYLHKLNENGIHWHSYSQPGLNSMHKEAKLTILVMSWLAEQERVYIGERTKAGMARVKAANPSKHMGRPRNEDARKLVHGLKGKMSIRKIAEDLSLSKSTVARFLKEPAPHGMTTRAKVVPFKPTL
ncbi:recombinase family protein [Nostoc sp. NIES-2111]